MEKEYKSEEIKPPLESWKATTLKFDAVALSKQKDQYTSEGLKALTEQKLDTIEAEISSGQMVRQAAARKEEVPESTYRTKSPENQAGIATQQESYARHLERKEWRCSERSNG